jgi:hypothetical protein
LSGLTITSTGLTSCAGSLKATVPATSSTTANSRS